MFRLLGFLIDLGPHGNKCKHRQFVLHSLELVVSDMSLSQIAVFHLGGIEAHLRHHLDDRFGHQKC